MHGQTGLVLQRLIQMSKMCICCNYYFEKYLCLNVYLLPTKLNTKIANHLEDGVEGSDETKAKSLANCLE